MFTFSRFLLILVVVIVAVWPLFCTYDNNKQTITNVTPTSPTKSTTAISGITLLNNLVKSWLEFQCSFISSIRINSNKCEKSLDNFD